MKRALFYPLFFSALFLNSCSWVQSIKSVESKIIGLKRRVTLYDCAGKPIRVWEGRFNIRDEGQGVRFVDDDFKTVRLDGTYVIEEL